MASKPWSDSVDVSPKDIADDFDPAALIEKAVQSDLDPAVFDLISEKDLPRAKNWLEWTTSKEFAGLDSPPFPRQIQIGINFLQDYCPYCSDMDFAQDMFDQKLTEIYDRVQMYHFGVCPKCGKTRLDALSDNLYPAVRTELDAVLGMRSGKSTLVAMISNYVLHKQLMYGSPSRFYSLMANQTLYMTFTAITAGQAYDTLWTPFREQYNAAPWFAMYNKFLSNECGRLGIDPLRMLDVDKDTFIWYGGQKNLTCSFSSADMRAIRGRTRFLTSIDELGWFDQNADSGKVRANADETHAALEKSLLTIRAAAQTLRERGIVDALPGLALNVSSPSSKNDKIMRLLAESKDDPTKLAAHYATWECCTGDTAIATSSGLLDICDMSSNSGLNQTKGKVVTQNELDSITYTYESPKPRSVYELKTVHEYGITAVGKHKVKVLTKDLDQEFKSISSLTEDDHVLISYKELPFGSKTNIDHASYQLDINAPHTLTPELAACLGYLVSEGTYTDKMQNCVTFYNSEVDVLDDFAKLANQSFNLSTSPYYKYDRYCFPKHSTYLQFFRRLGLGNDLSITKNIPVCVWQAPKQIVSAFLSGLYEGDGWPENHGTTKMIGYATSSPKLAKELRLMLLQFGIPSLISWKYPRMPQHKGQYTKNQFSNNLAFEVKIVGTYAVNKFISDIGFRSPKKKQLASKLTRVSSSVNPAFYDRLPDFVTTKLLELCNSISKPGVSVQSVFGQKANIPLYRMGRKLTKPALSKLLNSLDSFGWTVSITDKINKLRELTGELFFDQVKSVTKNSEREIVYDLTVRSTHEYWSNGLISHNCNPRIPLSSLRSEMRNRVVFDRDYGAIPPLAASPFLDDDKLVDKMQSNLNSGLTWQTKTHTDDSGDKSVYLEVHAAVSDKSYPTILTVDTGFANNSFAIAISRYNKETASAETFVALEVQPIDTADDKYNVNFPLMFEKCILPLCEAFNVIYAVYDRWNSIDQVQRLKDKKIHAEQYSLVWQDFLNFRTKVYDGNVKIPKAEKTLKEIKNSTVKFDTLIDNAPHTHLFVQLLTVREIGRKVVKPLGGTDDLFRCVVLASTYIFDPELTKKFEANGSVRGASQKSLGVMRSNSSGVSKTMATKSGSSNAIAVRKGFRNS